MLGISWLAEELSASQEGLWFVELLDVLSYWVSRLHGTLQVAGTSALTEKLIASKPLLSSLDCTAFRFSGRPGAMYCYFIACREMLRNVNVYRSGYKH